MIILPGLLVQSQATRSARGTASASVTSRSPLAWASRSASEVLAVISPREPSSAENCRVVPLRVM